jgi:hypothetical protein
VQYADVDDAMNYTQTERRSYRRALLGLRQSVDAWNGMAEKSEAQADSNGGGDGGSHRVPAAATAAAATVCSSVLTNPSTRRDGVEFVLQLGDLIDGQNSGTYAQGLQMASPQTANALAAVGREVARCRCQTWRNAMGNHELLNMQQAEAVNLVSGFSVGAACCDMLARLGDLLVCGCGSVLRTW